MIIYNHSGLCKIIEFKNLGCINISGVSEKLRKGCYFVTSNMKRGSEVWKDIRVLFNTKTNESVSIVGATKRHAPEDLCACALLGGETLLPCVANAFHFILFLPFSFYFHPSTDESRNDLIWSKNIIKF